MLFAGPILGSGTLELRCGDCRRKSNWDKRKLRAGLADGNRLARVEAAAQRELAAAQRQAAANQMAAQEVALAAARDSVEVLNQQLSDRKYALRTALSSSLGRADHFRLEDLKGHPALPVWNPGLLAQGLSAPDEASFAVAPLTGLASLKPGAKRRHEESLAEAQARYQQAGLEHERLEAERRRRLVQRSVSLLYL
jgi:hypothetical protein